VLPSAWQENLLHISKEAPSNTLKYANAKTFPGHRRLVLNSEAFSFDLKRMSESRRDCFRFPQESDKIRKTIKDVGQQLY
jgi:hypothetical protein